MCLDGSEEIVKFYTVKSFISASKVGQVYKNPWSPDWKRVWSFAVFAFGFATVDFFRVLRKHWDGRYFRGWIGMRLSFPNRSGVEWNARFRESKIFQLANLILELKFWYLVSASILRQAHLGASRDHDFRRRIQLLRYFWLSFWMLTIMFDEQKQFAPWENNLLLGKTTCSLGSHSSFGSSHQLAPIRVPRQIWSCFDLRQPQLRLNA